MVETVGLSQTFASICKTTWRHISRDKILRTIVCGAQVHEIYTNPNVSDPIRETTLLQKTLLIDIDALVIAKFCTLVLRVSVWDSCQISGLILEVATLFVYWGVRVPELEGCPLRLNPCNGEQEKTAD